MIRVSIKLKGLQNVARRLALRGEVLQKAAELALEEAGTIVQAEAQRLVMDPPKTGRFYEKYDPRRTHQASAPGEAPATDTGNLAAGIILDATDAAQGRVRVASTAPYSKVLEFGGRKVAARPFLRRALISKKKAIQQAFLTKMRDAL